MKKKKMISIIRIAKEMESLPLGVHPDNKHTRRWKFA